MHQSSPRPVVHLELHTGDQARASAFYAKLLCWRPELIEAGSGSYLALELGGGSAAASSNVAPRHSSTCPRDNAPC
jgi:predicted enzyme related to lactoylglutathione lyase